MTNGQEAKDLFVLVADEDMRQTMHKLLGRAPSLDIHALKYAVDRHLQRDPGCRTDAARSLRGLKANYRYALVMFDKDGCGNDRASREKIQLAVEQELSRNGWHNRSKAIVLDPELESWVWNTSEEVARILGWKASYDDLKTWLREEDLWPSNASKPPNPKQAMKAALRKNRQPVSAALFGELAASVTLRRCADPAFVELRDTLRTWFPKEPS